LASRLDLQVTCCDSSIVDGLRDLQEHSAVEVQRLRDDLQVQIDMLQSGLSTAGKEINRLDESIRKAVTFSESNYATKETQEAIHAAAEKSREQMHDKLKSAIEAVDLQKATRAQLDEAKAALRSADERIGRDLAATSASLAQTASSLVEVDTEFRRLFATNGALHEVSEKVTKLVEQINKAAEDRLSLRSELEAERARLRENTFQVQECWRVVGEAADDMHHLKAVRSMTDERIEKNEQALREFREFEKMHWEQSKEAFMLQEQGTAHVEGLCASLRADMQTLSEATKEEGERLRQYSTMRYLDQLDKALTLQQSVDQVQKGHKELQDSVMRSVKLPKVPIQ
jgi:chromosome segregation ATPase